MGISKFFAATIFITLIFVSLPASAEKLNSHTLESMQEHHLQQAEIKIAQEQYTHAWGDLAYIVCKVPNNKIALKYMMLLAPRLNKTKELQQYFANALLKFPNDTELLKLQAQMKDTKASSDSI